MSRSKPLSSVNPLFYSVSVFLRRQLRKLKWYFGREKYALKKTDETLPETVVTHRSILMRKLQGTDQALQKNKITSLRTASSFIDGIVYRENELWRKEINLSTSEILTEKLLMKNHAEVLYDVSKIPDIAIIEEN